MPATITLTHPRSDAALVILDQPHDVLARACSCPEVVIAAAGGRLPGSVWTGWASRPW